MRVAVVAPRAVPDTYGGAERLADGLVRAINDRSPHTAALVQLPSPERTFKEVVRSYQEFSALDLSGYDLVVTGKYPSWMADHPRQHLYLLHPLRGLYDTYDLCAPKFPPPAPDTEIREVRRILSRLQSRADFPALFEALAAVADTHDDDHPALAFPGPLIRDIIRELDRVATAPGPIKRFAAISATVTRRPGFLPPHVRVHVAHPPSELPGLTTGAASHLLTVSRLDRPKRVDLLIKAMRHVRADVRLLVAGTGPEQPRLLRLAAKDARVEFLGFVPDEQLVDLYAQAIAVPFVPLDEDFGLVTLEAGMAGKPVITALDSGGPRELVANGNNGLVVEPTPRAIGRAMTRLVEDPARAQELGLAAQRTANSVTWDTVLEQVLGEADRPALPPITRRPPRRSLAPRLVVVSTFPVHPRRGGGQLRAFHLYGRLAPAYDVEILSLTSPGASSPGWRSLGPGCRELVVEKTPEHLEGEAAASVAAGFPADDIVAARLVPLTPAFERALERSLEGASGVILCHPFLAEVAHRLRPDLPMIYDAHNAEIALKGQLLGGRPEAAHLVDEVRTSEALACHQSAFIAVASPDDVATLSREYGVRPEKMILVPNGVDTQAKAFVTSQERKANKASWRAAYPALAGMGVPDHLALFVASWHPPNIQAAKAIVAMAPELPEAQFLLVGSHADALDPNDLPGNVTQMGPVSEATLSRLLATADVGLNPMLSGGGSNLKMFEYLAVGLPVVTTAVGARGLAGGGERAFSVETIERFPSAISALLEHAQGAGRQARAGRKLVETVYDWEVLAGSLRQRIRTLVRGVPFGQPPAGILSASR